MFDKLEDLLHHYEELMNTLSEPDVANDPNRFRKLMKEQSDLQPIVDAYKEYKACKQTIEDSLAILDEESDEEMRELAKEELNEAKSRLGELAPRALSRSVGTGSLQGHARAARLLRRPCRSPGRSLAGDAEVH